MKGTSKDLKSQPFIYRFGDSFDEFIQVLVDEFTLTREEKGKCLKFRIDNNTLSIRNSKAKELLNIHLKKANKGDTNPLVDELKKFESDNQILSYRFNCSNFPFRYANGGVLPIIRINRKDYFCMFYRAIFPVGWNIANGAANDIDDIRNPVGIIHREFSEEFIIADHKEKYLYVFDAHNEETMCGTQEQALELWNKEISEGDLKEYTRKSIPLKWIEGRDKLELTYGNKIYSHEGFFLNITPGDNAIELDKIALINLMGRFSFYDGEVDYVSNKKGISTGHVLNRLIGFFPVEPLTKNLSSHRFEPEFFYYSGRRHEWEDFETTLKKYFARHVSLGLADEEGYKDHNLAEKINRDLDLCPIVRAVATQYDNWMKAEQETIDSIRKAKLGDDSPKTSAKESEKEKRTFQIFISFRSKDQNLAELLYDFLTNSGYHVFCSSKSIQLLGSSEYAREIDKALEESICLVVVSSDLKNFESGWVEYEWRTFQMLLFSGDKKGELFSLTQNMNPGDLPTGLRYRENIQIIDNAYQLSFRNLLGYIKKAIPKSDYPESGT